MCASGDSITGPSQSKSMEDLLLMEVEAGSVGVLTLFVCDRFLNMATTGSGELRCDTTLVSDCMGNPVTVEARSGAKSIEGLQAAIHHSPQVRRGTANS